jgi:hypothetical protein
MIKVKINDGVTDFFIGDESKEAVDPDTSLSVFWKGAIVSAGNIEIKINSKYGGYAKPSGKHKMSFKPIVLGFPAPRKVTVKIWSDSTLLMEGVGALNDTQPDFVSYSFFEPEFNQLALEVPTTSESKIVNSDEVIIDGAVIPIYFGNETSPTNAHLLARKVLKPSEISADENAARFYDSSIDTDLVLFDDGVNVTDNIVSSLGSEIKLEPKPIGEIRAFGKNTTTSTLNELFTWGTDKLTLSLDTSKARASSPKLSFQQETQIKVIDLLDKVAEAYGHLFYIRDGTLFLIDMLGFGESFTLTENEVENSVYQNSFSRREIKTNWGVVLPTTNASDYPFQLNISKSQAVDLDNATGGTQQVDNFFREIETVVGEIVNLEVIENLKVLGELHQRPRASTSLTFEQDINPGDEINYPETRLPVDTAIKFYARAFRFDLLKQRKSIEGDGIFFQTPPAPTTGQAEHVEDGTLKGQSRFRFGVVVDQTNAADADFITLEDALDTLKARDTGGRIFIRNGTYDLNDYELADLPWEIEGETKDGVIIQKSIDDPTPIFKARSNDQNVTFRNLTLQNEGFSSQASLLDFFAENECKLVVDNCNLNNDEPTAIAIGTIARWTEVTRCDCVVNNLIFHQPSTSKKSTVRILDNNITGVGNGAMLTFGFVSGVNRNVIVQGNNLIDVKILGIIVSGGDTIISGNTIEFFVYQSEQSVTNRRAIQVTSKEGVTISDNIISIDEEPNTVKLGVEAIHVSNADNIGKTIISGNEINIKIQAEDTWGVDVEGIEVVDTDNCTIENNTIIIDLDTYSASPEITNGIEILSGTNTRIRDNVFTLIGTPTASSYGIDLGSGTLEFVVKGNTSKGFTSVLNDAGTDNVIADNFG